MPISTEGSVLFNDALNTFYLQLNSKASPAAVTSRATLSDGGGGDY